MHGYMYILMPVYIYIYVCICIFTYLYVTVSKIPEKSILGGIYFGMGFQEKQSIMEGVMVTLNCYPNTT